MQRGLTSLDLGAVGNLTPDIRVSALSQEAFIVRLLRERNEVAFVKAFSDQPEHMTSGLAPLRNIVRELRLQHVHIYPRYFLLPWSALFLIVGRFHDEVKQTLEKKRIDIIQLLQGLTESMREIHGAIIQCINSTMSELKRSHTNVSIISAYQKHTYPITARP
jgi:DNA excision repair protein ERCC-4